MGGEKNQTVMGGEKNQTWMPLHMLLSGQGMSCSIEAASEQTICNCCMLCDMRFYEAKHVS